MLPVRVLTGTALPLNRGDVDTDQIIPAHWLKRVERTGYGAGLFSAWREEDPNFVLNRPEYRGASIVVAGPNFGIGSSREHAVWALQEAGFAAVVSAKFGDIFRNNATKSGLVPVVVAAEIGERLLQAVVDDPRLLITVDIERRLLLAPAAGIEVTFPLDDFTQYRLIEGLDDIGLTLRATDEVDLYESQRATWMPTVSRSPAL
ncbi:MAG: 3-isopropylmalate dehydratase small subunit [Chloroflexia bacterium]|nr:3-isopropylmalate dehydratase small subunit [Chloroflexia bacterium]